MFAASHLKNAHLCNVTLMIIFSPQVRDILQPYLASNPKDAIGKSRNAMMKK
jgi:hypothetical protein